MSTLTWDAYVRWTRTKVEQMFSSIGDGSEPTDAVYVIINTILDYCIHTYCPIYTERRIDLTINMYEVHPGDIWIRVNGNGLHLTSETLYQTIANSNRIRVYLSQLPETEVCEAKIPLEAITALSSLFCIESIRDNLCAVLKYENQIDHYDLVDKYEEDGICFHIVPDEDVFGKFSFKTEYIIPMLELITKENLGLTITLQEHFDGKQMAFKSISSIPMFTTLLEVEEIISQSVINKIVDIQTTDYCSLLSAGQKAVVIKINPDGTSGEIAERMVEALNSLHCGSKDVIYALEVQNKIALIPDHSIISQDMEALYNVKRSVVGTDGKDYNGQWDERLKYTSVVVGLIIPPDYETIC